MSEVVSYKNGEVIFDDEIATHGMRGYLHSRNIGRKRCGEEPVPIPVGHLKEKLQICMEWIEMYGAKQKTKGSGAFSYSLKHVVEREYDEYIPNGTFILAAKMMGYELLPDGDGVSYNAHFNMSLKKWRDEVKRRGYRYGYEQAPGRKRQPDGSFKTICNENAQLRQW